MKAMKKTWLIAVFAMLLACLFVTFGCDNLKTNDGDAGLRIDGANNFTASCVLREKKTFSSSAEIASIIEDASDGMVTADAVEASIVAEGSAVYNIELTELPKDINLDTYLERVAAAYLQSFEGWNNFPNSPVKYTTKDGKDVLVFINRGAESSAELNIFVLYFEAGSVNNLAASLGGQGGNNGGNHGSDGGNGGGYFDDGNGKTDGDDGYGDDGYGGDDTGDGSDDDKTEQDTPYQVRYTVYDVDEDGNLSLYESSLLNYGTEMSFDWCGFVVFEDVNFEKEIDPNQKIKLDKDIVVYRRDNLDRVPVFITVHYFVNGMELTGTVAHRNFFRGTLLTSSNLGGDEYEYYRGAKGKKMFESGVEVVREEDDKLNIYAYREDPLFHKVTFKIGTNEIGTTLIYEGSVIGRYSAMDLGGETQYEILDCDAVESSVMGDLTVNITDYIVYHYVTITVHCCYEGDIKYSYVNYWGFDEEGRIEVSEAMNLYDSVECTSRFVGFITSSATFYNPIILEQ